jgi:hypothetical protein
MSPQSDEAFTEALASLVGNPYFRVFVSRLAEFKDDALRDAMRIDIITDARATETLLGEARAYTKILDTIADVGAGPLD